MQFANGDLCIRNPAMSALLVASGDHLGLSLLLERQLRLDLRHFIADIKLLLADIWIVQCKVQALNIIDDVYLALRNDTLP